MSKTAGLWIGTIAAAGMIGAVAAAMPEGKPRLPQWPGEASVSPSRLDSLVTQATARLQLTGPQQQNLRVLMQRLGQAQRSLAEARAEARTGMLDLLAAPRLDQQSALRLVRQRGHAVEAEAPAVIEAFADFHDSLDDLQRARLRELMTAGMYAAYGHPDVIL
jgi:uncharacterized membrane protein